MKNVKKELNFIDCKVYFITCKAKRDVFMSRLSLNAKAILEQTMRQSMRDAVYELLAEKELNNISIADVAKKLNISSVTVYNYYSSRRLLIDEAINESRRKMMEKLTRCSKNFTSPEDKLMALARVICEDFEQHRFLFMARFAVVPQDDENALSAREYFKVIIDCFASAIESGIEQGVFRKIDAQYGAMSLLGALMSFNRHASFKWIDLSIDERLQKIKSIIIDGFKI